MTSFRSRPRPLGAMDSARWIRRLRGAALVLLPVALAAFSARPVFRMLPYGPDEHSLAADHGAGRVVLPGGVKLPEEIFFEEGPGRAYSDRVREAKMLAVGIDSNNQDDATRIAVGLQDNCYAGAFRQRSFNLNMYVPIDEVVPEKVLRIPGYVVNDSTPTLFTFGELVALYGDFRRTTYCDVQGRCFLTNRDVETIRFDKGDVPDPLGIVCPPPMPAGKYLRMIGSGLLAPYGRVGNVTSTTAGELEIGEAGWWGDEMMRGATLNESHFSNVAVAWYVGMHRLALLYATQAQTNPHLWAKALHHEASAVHALTDLFAFGHVVVNRDESSYLMARFSSPGATGSGQFVSMDLRTHPTHMWMENVIRLGGGSREELPRTCPEAKDRAAAAEAMEIGVCAEGRVNLTADLPSIRPRGGARDDFMPSYAWFDLGVLPVRGGTSLPLIAVEEESLHTRFNDGGARVANLAGNKFLIKGDYKLHPTVGSDPTLAAISTAVRESLQSLFDAQNSIRSNSSTLEEMAKKGSEFFRALKYVPVFIIRDPQYNHFVGMWTLYAGIVEELTGMHTLPDNWGDCMIPYINGTAGHTPPQPALEPCDAPPKPSVVAAMPDPVLEVRKEQRAETAPADPPEPTATPVDDIPDENTAPLPEFLVYDDLMAYFTPARDTTQEQFRWRIAKDDVAVAAFGLFDPINPELTERTERAGPDAPGIFMADLGVLEDQGPGTYLLETCELEDRAPGAFGAQGGWNGCGPWREEERFEVGDVRLHLQGVVVEEGALEIDLYSNITQPPGTLTLEQRSGSSAQEGGAQREVVLDVVGNWLRVLASEGLGVVGPDSVATLTRDAAEFLTREGPNLGEGDLEVIVDERPYRWGDFRDQEGPWINGRAVILGPQSARTRLVLSLPEILDPNTDSIAGVIGARMEIVTPGFLSAVEEEPAQFETVIRPLVPTDRPLDRSIGFDNLDWDLAIEDEAEREARAAEQPGAWGRIEVLQPSAGPGASTVRNGGLITMDGAQRAFNLHHGRTSDWVQDDDHPWFSQMVRDPGVRWFVPIQVSIGVANAVYAFAVYGVHPGQYDGPAPKVPDPVNPTDPAIVASTEGGAGQNDDPGDPSDPRAGAAAGPIDPAALNPDSRDVGDAIRQWIGVARPSDTVDEDVSYGYDQWGRAVGERGGGIITGGGPPGDRAGRTPEAYVWGIRDDLDSVDHCTLGDFVVRTLSRSGTGECQGRYTPAPRLADFADRPVTEVTDELQGRGVNVRVRMSQPARTAALAHTVIAQTPAAGTRVREGQTVDLTIRGEFADLVVVPKVDGLPSATARNRLEQAGLRATTAPGPAAPTRDLENIVIRQQPRPGFEVARGATVELIVHSAIDPAQGRGQECGQLVSEGMRAHTSGNYDRALLLYGEARALGCRNPRLDDANTQAATAKTDEARRRVQQEEERRRREDDARRVRSEEQREARCGTLIDQGQSSYRAGRKSEALGHYQEAQRLRCQEYANADLDSFINWLIGEVNQQNRANELQPRCDALVRQGRDDLNSGKYGGATNTLSEAMNLGCPNSGLDDLLRTASDCNLQLTVLRQARGWGNDTSMQESMFRDCPNAPAHIEQLPPAAGPDPATLPPSRDVPPATPRLADPNVLARICPASVGLGSRTFTLTSAVGEPNIEAGFRCNYGPLGGGGTAFGWNYHRAYRSDGGTYCRRSEGDINGGGLKSQTHSMEVWIDRQMTNWREILRMILREGEAAGVAVPCRW